VKKIILSAMIAAVMVLSLSGCAARLDGNGTGFISAGESEKNPKSITVSAQGTVKVMPDVAYVTVGVTTQDADMQKAQDNNAQTMNAMYEALKGAGLADDDIRTTQYNAYPIYDYSSETKKIMSYEVTNQVELTIKDINRVGEIIDIAVNNGANTTNSISFGLLDEQSSYNDALKLAVDAAKAKAETLAEAGGVKIIGTLQMAENSIGGQIYREYAEAAVEDTGSTPISTGDLEIQANVTVVYEIE
jgi:uncharacterized protein YggE